MTSDRHANANEAIEEIASYIRGFRPNIGQFAQQLVQGYASLVRSRQVDPEETPCAEILPLLALRLR